MDQPSLPFLIEGARELEHRNDLDSAIHLFSNAVTQAQLQDNWQNLLMAKAGVHRCRISLFQYDSVISDLAPFLQALPDNLQPQPSLAEIYDHLAKAYVHQGNYKQCIAAAQRAQEIKETLEVSREEKALSLDLQADSHRSLDQMLAAREKYQEILDMFTLNGQYEDHVKVSATLADVAILDRIEGNYEGAIERYKQAQTMIEKFPDAHWSTLASIYNGLGIVYATIGNHPLSLEYFEKLLESDLQHLEPTDPDLARSYTNLAIINEMMGDLKQSVSLHERALAIKISSLGDDHPSLVYDYKGLATVYNSMGDIEQTLVFLHKTEQLEKKHLSSDSRNLAMSYNQMGSCYRLKQDLVQAQKYLQKAQEIIIGKDPYDPQAGPIYHNLASLFLGKEDYPMAQHYAERALQTNRRNFGDHHQHMAGNFEMLGSIFEAQGRLAQAADYFQRSLEISKKVDGAAHQNVAKAYGRLANNARLAGAYANSLEYTQLALVAGSEDFAGSTTSSNPVPSQTSVPKDLASILTIKGRTLMDQYAQSGNFDALYEALDAFESAIDMINAAQFSYQSKGSVAHLKKEFLSTYEHALEACHLLFENENDPQYIEKALHFAELSKSTLLVASLNESRARKFAGIPDSLLSKELDLRRDITYWEELAKNAPNTQDADPGAAGKIFTLKQAYQKLMQHFESQFPKYYQLKFDASTVTMSDVRENLLAEDEILVEYFAGNHRGYGIAISQEDAKIFQIRDFLDLENNIRDIGTFLKDRNQNVEEFVEISGALYTHLIEPIAELAGDRQMIIVPDGVINYLPFEVLVVGVDTTNPYGTFDLPYLFKEHTISYAYSGTVLHESRYQEDPDNASNFLAFAPVFKQRDQFGNLKDPTLIPNVSYRAELAELAGAKKEVEILSSHFKGEVFTDLSATEQRFKERSKGYGILHLATHAIIDDLNPMNSKLLFTASQDSLEDSDLHAWEIFNMQFNAQLAVLSACNTGFGKIQKGEGVLSLGRAFAFAGCPSVLMSLWPAQDQITSQMMSHFYRHLADGWSKDDALRKAKLIYLAEAEEFNLHPFYWAGFILQGDRSSLIKPVSSSWVWGTGILLISLLVFLVLAKALRFFCLMV